MPWKTNNSCNLQKEKSSAKNCRGVSHTPSTAAKMKIGNASIQAKRQEGVVRSREGRMRYAPTPVRSILGKLRSHGVRVDSQ